VTVDAPELLAAALAVVVLLLGCLYMLSDTDGWDDQR
jgi:hypothetical protein